ncbi:MAG TPA: GHMP kinase [Candidatus Bathyarchaeia archaeon]|nr:GHMP kinase [Candidatus Bathyarchaeia archaeon]
MRIRARAPLRVSYAGGGTDVPPYPSLVGGVVLSSTIKNYAYCSLSTRSDKRVTIIQENTGTVSEAPSRSELQGEGEVALVKAVANRFSPDSGFDASLRYDALPGAGLGSSSALCVSLIGALKELNGSSMSDYEIAKLAYEVERKDAGVPGGLQDQYASTFGGFNLIEFKPAATIVNPLRIKRETLHELEYNSLLCFTGTTRRSGGILKRQIESYERKDSGALETLQKMKNLTFEMKDKLLTGNLTEFATLLNSEWELKKRLDEAISTLESDRLLLAAREAGAIGGKLLGAGGGGFIFVYCESGKQNQVQQTLEKMGGRTYPVRFDKDGLQTWRTPN